MKKKVFIIIIAIIVLHIVVITALALTYDCTWKETCFTYKFWLFDHITYNGEAYYFMEDQSDCYWCIDQDTEFEVSIIKKNGDVHSTRTYTAYAYAYEGDDELEFLYFNSAIYTKNLSYPVIVNDKIISDGRIE